MTRKFFCLLFITIFCLPAQIAAAAETTQEEFRGVWIATVGNANWPSKKGLAASEQKEEFVRLLDSASALNLNAVVVQVRPTSDAFYSSELNPWSEYLTGTQGEDPGYDPLAFIIEQAHARQMEFHAWFNPFRVSTVKPKTIADNSVIKTHPDWVVGYGKMQWLDPGLPEARDFAVSSVLEVVNKYDIDAVHFDDYFYPYPEGSKSFPDDASYAAYGENEDRENWRRQNINSFIQNVSDGVKKAKPGVKFGVSPIGIWRSNNVDAEGSATTAKGSYDSVYADTRYWVRSGWVDYVAPQIYWEIGFEKASYEKLLDFWVREAEANPRVHLYIGQAAYRIGSSGAWTDPQEMVRQLTLNRDSRFVKGSVFYSIDSLLENPLSIRQTLLNNFYQTPAQIPTMPWLASKSEE